MPTIDPNTADTEAEVVADFIQFALSEGCRLAERDSASPSDWRERAHALMDCALVAPQWLAGRNLAERTPLARLEERCVGMGGTDVLIACLVRHGMDQRARDLLAAELALPPALRRTPLVESGRGQPPLVVAPSMA
jgi:hypothetical protein